jgi:uncharacterized protein
MHVNVSQLIQDEIGARRTYEFDEPVDHGKAVCSVNMLRTDAGVLVHVEGEVPASMDCGRCLQTFVMKTHVRFDEEFFPSVNMLTGAVLAPPEDDAFMLSEHYELDLWEAVRQYSVLVEPMTFVCRNGECQGLCDQCGADQNEAACSCKEPAKHPGFAALQREWDSQSNTVDAPT